MKKILNIKPLLLLIIILASCNPMDLSDTQKDNFVKFYGNGDGSYGNDLVELSGGGYFLTGYQYDGNQKKLIVLSTDEFGNNVNYNSDYNIYENPGNNVNAEGKKIVAFEGDYLIAGQMEKNGSEHMFLMKVNASGDSLWFRDYSDTLKALNFSNSFVNDIAIIDDEIFLVGKFQNGTNTTFDKFMLITDLSGNYQANKYKIVAGDEEYVRIKVKSNGNILISDYSTTLNRSQCYEIPIYNLTGGLNFYPTFEGKISDVINTNDILTILVNGRPGYSTPIIMKIDASADAVPTFLWDELIPIEEFLANSIDIIEGGYIVSGNIGSTIHTIVLDTDGNVSKSNMSPYQGFSENILSTSDGGFIIVGATPALYGSMIQLIKTDADYTIFNY